MYLKKLRTIKEKGGWRLTQYTHWHICVEFSFQKTPYLYLTVSISDFFGILHFYGWFLFSNFELLTNVAHIIIFSNVKWLSFDEQANRLSIFNKFRNNRNWNDKGSNFLFSSFEVNILEYQYTNIIFFSFFEVYILHYQYINILQIKNLIEVHHVALLKRIRTKLSTLKKINKEKKRVRDDLKEPYSSINLECP